MSVNTGISTTANNGPDSCKCDAKSIYTCSNPDLQMITTGKMINGDNFIHSTCGCTCHTRKEDIPYAKDNENREGR